LEENSLNLKKLRDSIYENDIFESATETQKETFYKMLKALISRTQLYMKTFKDKKHVADTLPYLEELQKTITSNDINFYINTMLERLDWYYENEKKPGNEDSFIAAADVIILWPLRAINERMYRNLFDKTCDERFDRVFEQAEEK